MSGLSDYQSYRNLPALAGLGTMTDAMGIGLSVEECVRRLKRHHWTWRRLHEIFIARLTAEPIYELKMGFSLHAHYSAEHAAAWRRRVGEMREPPLGLDVVPDPSLDAFFDEVGSAPDTAALLVGLYEHAVPALHAALERHMADTNCLLDQPSRRICRFALLEVEDMQAYGAQAVSSLVESERREELAGWERLLRDLLANAGGLDGTEGSLRTEGTFPNGCSRAAIAPTSAHRDATSGFPIPTTWASTPRRSSTTRPCLRRRRR